MDLSRVMTILTNVIWEAIDWARKNGYECDEDSVDSQHVMLLCGDVKLDVTYNGVYIVVMRNDNELYVADFDPEYDNGLYVKQITDLLNCALEGNETPKVKSLCERLYSAPDCHNVECLVSDNDIVDYLTTRMRMGRLETGRRSETYSAFTLDGTQFIVVPHEVGVNITYIRSDNSILYMNLKKGSDIDTIVKVCRSLAERTNRKDLSGYIHPFERSIIDF